MLGQYNWLLHSCACTLKGNLGAPRGVASVSKHIAPTSTHRNCHCNIATLLIEDVLLSLPGCLPGCYISTMASLFIEVAELDTYFWSLSSFWMDIFDLRKLSCRHSSLVEQARFAWGLRCSTKIWRNYTTRSSPSPSCHTHPSSSTSSHTFSNLFLTSHNLFIHLSALFGKLNPFHKNTGNPESRYQMYKSLISTKNGILHSNYQQNFNLHF